MSDSLPEQAARTLLIVDDEPVILNFVSFVLKDAGFHIIGAGSGTEALTKSREYNGKIDLLLSDIQMHGMTGVELGGTINGERPETKVMLMSGFTGGMLVLNDGWHFLHKPFVPSQLKDLVTSILRQPEVPDLTEHRSHTTGGG